MGGGGLKGTRAQQNRCRHERALQCTRGCSGFSFDKGGVWAPCQLLGTLQGTGRSKQQCRQTVGAHSVAPLPVAALPGQTCPPLQ